MPGSDFLQWGAAGAEYILFTHDATAEEPSAWDPYLQGLDRKGVFEGSSETGAGIRVRKGGAPLDVTQHLAGYIRVTAATIEEAKSLLAGNPHFEAGGTVEIRELPRT